MSIAGSDRDAARRQDPAESLQYFGFGLSPELKLMAVEITLEPHASMGIPRALFEAKIRPVQLSYQYDVSPDGQRFLVLRTVKDQYEPPLTLVHNWAKELASR